jgi:hypothetical protein
LNYVKSAVRYALGMNHTCIPYEACCFGHTRKWHRTHKYSCMDSTYYMLCKVCKYKMLDY